MRTIDKIYRLPNYCEKDVWDLKEIPLNHINIAAKGLGSTIIDFRPLSNVQLKKELKFYLFSNLSSKEKMPNYSARSLKLFYIYPSNVLIVYLAEISPNIQSFRDVDSKLIREYKLYLKNKVASGQTKLKKGAVITKRLPILLKSLFLFYMEKYDKRSYFEREIWHLKELNISKSRINRSFQVKTYTFYEIENQMNKHIFKLFIKYLLQTTSLSTNTIYAIYSDVKQFLIFLGSIDVDRISRKDAERYIAFLNTKSLINRTYNREIYSLKRFIDYSVVKGFCKKNHFYFEDTKEGSITFRLKTVSQYTIDQIFNVIQKAPLQLAAMFLTLYSTGMRVSEVCTIERSNVYKDHNGYFIRFYQQKMRKEVVNLIPKSLYSLLKKQSLAVQDRFPGDARYLFPSSKNTAYMSNTFRGQLRSFFNKNNIKNPDGTLYNFRPHEYRHTMATELVKRKVPLSVIQKVLHHVSPEMTFAYIEINDKRRMKKYKEFINTKGVSVRLIPTDIKKDAEVEWMRKEINVQALPNGICTLSVRFGKCPHANACLTCKYFVTSEEYLPVLKKQLALTIKYLKAAKKNGWTRQIETNEEVKHNLTRIIKKLEEKVSSENGKI